MKLKQRPEDFQVVEKTRYVPDPRGRFALYRVRKRGLATLEVVEILARMWRLPKAAIGFGGLKDKYGATEQVISVERGPARGLRQERLELEFLARSRDPIRRESFAGNTFVITVRDLVPGETALLRDRIGEVVRGGVPNYFDTQRFGSARGSGEFAVKRLLLGDNEGALRLALAIPTQEDRRRQREIRSILKAHWGDWTACHRLLPVCSERSVVTYLEDHPDGFRRAFELIDRNLRNLYCSAYQSHLWNRVLARRVRARAGAGAIEVPYGLGAFVFYEMLPQAEVESLRALSIPAPRHTLKIEDPELARLFERAFEEEGILQKDFRLRGMQDTYFKRGNRPALVFPEGLTAEPDVADEMNRGRRRVTLRFALPRGSYATIVIKRLTLKPPSPDSAPDAGDGDGPDDDAGEAGEG
jgi:tRNA pseudouridine13 synthase